MKLTPAEIILHCYVLNASSAVHRKPRTFSVTCVCLQLWAHCESIHWVLCIGQAGSARVFVSQKQEEQMNGTWVFEDLQVLWFKGSLKKAQQFRQGFFPA